jgi:hypothetical protein
LRLPRSFPRSAALIVVTYCLCGLAARTPILGTIGLRFEDALQQIGSTHAATYCRVVEIDTSDYATWFGSRSPLAPRTLSSIIYSLLAFRPAVLAIDLDTAAADFAAVPMPVSRGATVLVWARRGTPQGETVLPGAVWGTTIDQPVRSGVAFYLDDADGRLRQFPSGVRFGSRTLATFHWATLAAWCSSKATGGVGAEPAVCAAAAGPGAVAGSSSPRLRDIPSLVVKLRDLLPAVAAPAGAAPGSATTAAPPVELADNLLRDRVVILAGSYGEEDRHRTSLGRAYGGETIGRVVEAELEGDTYRVVPAWALYALKGVLGLLTFGIYHRYGRRSPLLALCLSAGAFGAMAAAAIAGTVYLGTFWLDAALFVTAMAATAAVRTDAASGAVHPQARLAAGAVDAPPAFAADLAGEVQTIPHQWESLTIHFELARDGTPITVVDSAAGSGRGPLRLPAGEIDALLAHGFADATRGETRDTHPAPPGAAAPQAIGDLLYRALFSGVPGELWQRARGMAEARDQGLRLELTMTLDDPSLAKLARLPWELLYEQSARRFLFRGNRRLLLTRSPEAFQPVSPLPVVLPLRVLIALAAPAGFVELDGPGEWQLVREAWAGRADVAVTCLRQTTLKALREKLLEIDPHIVHVVGHGARLPASGEGAIVLEDETGGAHLVSGQTLADHLLDHHVQLAVLNACGTARLSTDLNASLLSGVATALIAGGVPAVIAMQRSISDQAAVRLSGVLYRRLAAGDPVDVAVAEARLALSTTGIDHFEWATPVLYLRTRDSRIFKVAQPVWNDRFPVAVRS